MVGCNRFIRLIVLTLGVYLLTINVILWATDPDISYGLFLESFNTTKLGSFNNYQYFHEFSMTRYRGFSWFFDRLSTFKGPIFTIEVISKYADLVSGFSVTKNVGLDILIAIFRVLTTPILFSITVVIDIVNNAVWFVGFLG